MERKIIAIDCGKMNMKAKCGDVEFIYRNRYNRGSSDLQGANTWNVIYKSEPFVVGDNGTQSDTREGKASEEHIMCALTAMTHFLEPEKVENVVLIYGESITKYLDSKNRQAIVDRFVGLHEIVVDGKKFKINIEIVHVLPEGIGHIIQDLPNYMGTQYVIDIGGKTINFLSLENGRLIEDESFSEGKGILNIENKVAKEIKRRFTELPDRVISQYIKEGAPVQEYNQIISDAIYEQFEKFDNVLNRENIYIHELCESHGVSFVGGGSELFRPEIESYYKRARIIDEAVMSNVRGFYTYGVARYGQSVEAPATTRRRATTRG